MSTDSPTVLNNYVSQEPININDRNIFIPNAVYYQWNTKNKSFIDMHLYLKSIGIKNNAFHLILYDRDLENIDPHDPNLSLFFKTKVLAECKRNYWYFIREIIRIPTEGGANVRYKLHRGNMAANYCFLRNINTFMEFPRQNFKTVTVEIWYLWLYNFGTANSSIMFMHKKHDQSKENLAEMLNIRDQLPIYLRFDDDFYIDPVTGKKKKGTSNKTYIDNVYNNNKITTFASARSETLADSMGRGCKQPCQWYDEFAFIPFIKTVYAAATPAFSQASQNAANNGAPYGIIITTTPGDMRTDSGRTAFVKKDIATKWSESFYDLTPAALYQLLSNNTSSSFVYIRYTYKQLGRSEAWFKKQVIELEKDWAKIRREVLLEWADVTEDSPFDREDLATIKSLIKDPIATLPVLNGKYRIDIYKKADIINYPPIIGVDIANALYRDSSAITIIDSNTTEVLGTFNCNYVEANELAGIIIELVVNYMPNAVINVESNIDSVVKILMRSQVKNNLFFEYKERVITERLNNGIINHGKQKVRSYGTYNTTIVRSNLVEILHNRVKYHKDKFHAQILYDELAGLVIKNNRLDHSEISHDDQIMSYLLALYVYYYGENLMSTFGITKKVLLTDDNSEAYEIITDNSNNINSNIFVSDINTSDNEVLRRQLEFIKESEIKTTQDMFNNDIIEDSRKMADAFREDPFAEKIFKSANNYSDYNMTGQTLAGGLTNLNPSIFSDTIDDDPFDYYNKY